MLGTLEPGWALQPGLGVRGRRAFLRVEKAGAALGCRSHWGW